MGFGVHYSLFFLFYVLLNSDSSFAQKPHMEATMWPEEVLNHHQQDQISSFPSTFTTQLDDIPIIQPTTPTGTMNPPTPFPPSTTTPTPTGDPTTLPPPTPFQPYNPTPPGQIDQPGPTGPTGQIGQPGQAGPTNPTSPSGQTGQPGQAGPTSPTGQSGPSSSTGSWCVASPTASETALQVALDYACGYGGADCSAIQSGGSCYNPNTVRDHASYAFNTYYQKNPVPTSCSFGGVAQLTSTDPSSGSCRYSTPKTTSMTPPPAPTMPTAPTTPTISSPINPYPTSPSTPTGYSDQPGYTSSEPTAEPSSAGLISFNLLLILPLTSLIIFLNREK